MHKDDKDFLNEGIKVGVWVFAICVLMNIIWDLRDIQTELENVKREHHVIIEYKPLETKKDTMYIIKKVPYEANDTKF